MKPDAYTSERIKYLAIAGRAIAETSNENTHETNFFLAREALKKFSEGLHQLELPQEDMWGMEMLIEYLDKKIERRLNNSAAAGESI